MHWCRVLGVLLTIAMGNLMKFEWDTIDEGYHEDLGSTLRAKVFGGWVIRNTSEKPIEEDSNVYNISESMVFIPDPNHEWVIDNE